MVSGAELDPTDSDIETIVRPNSRPRFVTVCPNTCTSHGIDKQVRIRFARLKLLCYPLVFLGTKEHTH